MSRVRALGVLRETAHSPGRETDDYLILTSVLTELARFGVDTRLMTPEEFDACDAAGFNLVLPMCESYPRLKKLADIAGRGGPLLINAPRAVLNCYRTRMTATLARRPDISFLPSEIRRVADGPDEPPRSFAAPEGWWLKRGDVHNTCDRDVVRVRDWAHAGRVLRDFRSREITHVVVSPHIPGDLIKFYGVGPGRWSAWFYHDPGRIQGFPFETETLAEVAAAAARTLGLEIFGGDVIVSPERKLTFIDLNSWPSFAKVRGGAAPQIAQHVRSRLRSSDLAAKKSHALQLMNPPRRR